MKLEFKHWLVQESLPEDLGDKLGNLRYKLTKPKAWWHSLKDTAEDKFLALTGNKVKDKTPEQRNKEFYDRYIKDSQTVNKDKILPKNDVRTILISGMDSRSGLINSESLNLFNNKIDKSTQAILNLMALHNDGHIPQVFSSNTREALGGKSVEECVRSIATQYLVGGYIPIEALSFLTTIIFRIPNKTDKAVVQKRLLRQKAEINEKLLNPKLRGIVKTKLNNNLDKINVALDRLHASKERRYTNKLAYYLLNLTDNYGGMSNVQGYGPAILIHKFMLDAVKRAGIIPSLSDNPKLGIDGQILKQIPNLAPYVNENPNGSGLIFGFNIDTWQMQWLQEMARKIGGMPGFTQVNYSSTAYSQDEKQRQMQHVSSKDDQTQDVENSAYMFDPYGPQGIESDPNLDFGNTG